MKTTSVKATSRVKKRRIGIYGGTFDPVHAGHIAFALQAVKVAKLDQVYFLPERSPRHKQHITHYAHRVAMIRSATRPYAQLDVLETEDKAFSVTRTWPRLQKRFSGAQLVLLCGSDVLRHMSKWPHVARLLTAAELCIGRREGEAHHKVEMSLALLEVPPQRAIIVDSFSPKVSSSLVRRAIRQRRKVHGLLDSVRNYASREWLYL